MFNNNEADKYNYGKFLNEIESFIVNKKEYIKFLESKQEGKDSFLAQKFSPEPSTAKHMSEWNQMEALKQKELRLRHGVVYSDYFQDKNKESIG